jgi:hypothetical protein
MNELKVAVNQIVEASIEAINETSRDETAHLANLTAHLFKRCLHNLLSSAAVCGSTKIEAFKILMQHEKFWVALFGVCAELVMALMWPVNANASAPVPSKDHHFWQTTAYEMWHLTRCATAATALAMQVFF